jgi:hypothetical protein
VPVPPVGDLPVAASRTFTVPIRFPALSLGGFRAVVKVDPFGAVGTGQAATDVTPWGLVALALGLPLGAVARLISVRRRRVAVARRWLAPPVRLRTAPPAAGLAPQPVPGWYPDPLSEAELRLWDGRRWTAATQVGSAAAPSPTTPHHRPSGGPLTLVLEDSP